MTIELLDDTKPILTPAVVKKTITELTRILSRIDRKANHSNKHIASIRQGVVEAVISLNKL